MTAATHPSGTDRIAEVARERDWAEGDIVVNVQADEPLIAQRADWPGGAAARSIARVCDMATLATAIGVDGGVSGSECRQGGDGCTGPCSVLQPCARCHGTATVRQRGAGHKGFTGSLRHIGIYAYRVAALRKLTLLPPSPLELRERLEQLRALEHGMQIQVGTASEAPGPDVNTPEDLLRVGRLLGA